MSRIRSKDTQPELAVQRVLHSLGFRYVLHDKRLPGKPDLVFPARRKVIFVHGCFWHGHGCARSSRPKTNSAYWTEKIAGNNARDRRQRRALGALRWRVLVVFECAAKKSRAEALSTRLVKFLND